MSTHAVKARGYKFKIGEWVIFTHHVYLRTNEDGERVISAISSKGMGQIAGAVRRKLGLYSQVESADKDNPGESKDLYRLSQTGTAELYLVKQGMINKPVEVLEEHLIGCARPKTDLPWFYSIDAKAGKRMKRSLVQQIRRVKR